MYQWYQLVVGFNCGLHLVLCISMIVLSCLQGASWYFILMVIGGFIAFVGNGAAYKTTQADHGGGAAFALQLIIMFSRFIAGIGVILCTISLVYISATIYSAIWIAVIVYLAITSLPFLLVFGTMFLNKD